MGEFPFRFYGRYPSDWLEGANDGHAFSLQLVAAPDDATLERIAQTFERELDGGAAQLSAEPWSWSGRFAHFRVGERGRVGTAILKPVSAALRATHRFAPIRDVVYVNAREGSGRWDEWSLAQGPPDAGPAGFAYLGMFRRPTLDTLPAYSPSDVFEAARRAAWAELDADRRAAQAARAEQKRAARAAAPRPPKRPRPKRATKKKPAIELAPSDVRLQDPGDVTRPTDADRARFPERATVVAARDGRLFAAWSDDGAPVGRRLGRGDEEGGVTHIDVADAPWARRGIHGVAVDPDGRHLFVKSFLDVHRVDARTGEHEPVLRSGSTTRRERGVLHSLHVPAGDHIVAVHERWATWTERDPAGEWRSAYETKIVASERSAYCAALDCLLLHTKSKPKAQLFVRCADELVKVWSHTVPLSDVHVDGPTVVVFPHPSQALELTGLADRCAWERERRPG